MKVIFFIYFTVLLFLKANTSGAWELSPEYYFLSSSEESAFDDPSLTDSEYSSDILAFSRSSKEDYSFFLSQRHLLIGMGSVGSKNFMINDQLKIQQSLSDQLEFRLRYFKEKDFDQEMQAQVVELNYWFHPIVGLGVYGESAYRKSEIDLGLAVLGRPVEDHEIRFFWTSPDFARNERNKNQDSFSKTPHSEGLVGRWVSKSSEEFLVYSIRNEKPVHWDFPVDSYRYKFQRQVASIYSRKSFDQGFLTLRWQGEKKKEEKVSLTSSSSFAGNEMMHRERHLALVDWEHENFFENRGKSLRGGFFVTQRKYQKYSMRASQTTVLPYLWLRTPALRSAGVQDFWQIGLDTAAFRETGAETLTHRQHRNSVMLESRLSTSYDFYFANQAQLRLIFSFDIDEFGTGETWEGGAGTFQMNF